MKNKNLILIILFVTLGVLMFIATMFNLNNSSIAERDVPCYDRRGNVIEGLVCKEVLPEDLSSIIIGAIISGICFSIALHIKLSESYNEKMRCENDYK